MNRAEAIAKLTANPDAALVLRVNYVIGLYWASHAVWLDADGDLVMAHPTDPRAQPIAAPESDRYHWASDWGDEP